MVRMRCDLRMDSVMMERMARMKRYLRRRLGRGALLELVGGVFSVVRIKEEENDVEMGSGGSRGGGGSGTPTAVTIGGVDKGGRRRSSGKMEVDAEEEDDGDVETMVDVD